MLTIDHDLHVHTYLSACCQDKDNHRPATILAATEAMGLRTVGFADHVWANPAIEPNAWYKPQGLGQIARLRDDLAEIDSAVRVLVGCEAETIAPGQFGITPEVAAELDFVQLACSHMHMKGFVAAPPSGRPRDVAAHCLAFFRSAAASGLATIIPHSFLPLGYLENLPTALATISDAEFFDAYSIAAEHGVGIEITTGYLAPDDRRDAAVRFLSLAKRAGCKFTFGSDAHDLSRLQRLMELTCFIEDLGLTEDDILPLARRVN